MSKSISTQERADRQRIMMGLRSWMERESVPRQEVADSLGITRGHFSTLINANRSATWVQCEKAMVLMDTKFAVSKHVPRYEGLGVSPIRKRKEMRPEPKKKKKAKKKPIRLRPMTKFEAQFVTDVAKAWIKDNRSASRDRLVEVVRALSIGIRT